MPLSMLDRKTAKARFHGNYGDLTLISYPCLEDEKIKIKMIFFSEVSHNLNFFKELRTEVNKIITWIENQQQKEATALSD